MTLPPELEHRFREELELFEEEQKMPYITSIERLGREEGLQEGIQIRLDQGLRRGLLDGIELSLRAKFGATSQDALLEIRQLTDLTIIQAVIAKVETSRTIEEVRDVYR